MNIPKGYYYLQTHNGLLWRESDEVFAVPQKMPDTWDGENERLDFIKWLQRYAYFDIEDAKKTANSINEKWKGGVVEVFFVEFIQRGVCK